MVKHLRCGDPGSIPGSGRSPGEGNGNPLQYSCLKISMDRGAWWATVHGVTKSQTQLNDFTLMIFPVVMCGCESWTIKKAKHWRIDAFELWCWKRLLRVCWTTRISNQSTLKEINPKYSLEGLVLKLKFQYFDHLMCRANSLEKTLMLGKIGSRGTTEDAMVGWHLWFNGHEFEQALGDGDGQGSLAFCSPWGCKESVTT